MRSLILLLLLAACRTAASRAVVEPSEASIVDLLDRGENSRSENVLWITNRSSVPVIVTSVTLRECDNVVLPCGEPIRMAVSIPPGQRRVVLRVRPKHEANSMTYDYAFAWRRDDGVAVAVP